jgi:hypothetical protein
MKTEKINKLKIMLDNIAHEYASNKYNQPTSIILSQEGFFACMKEDLAVNFLVFVDDHCERAGHHLYKYNGNIYTIIEIWNEWLSIYLQPITP